MFVHINMYIYIYRERDIAVDNVKTVRTVQTVAITLHPGA